MYQTELNDEIARRFLKRDRVTQAELVDVVETGQSNVSQVLGTRIEDGYIEEIGTAEYRATGAGRRAFAEYLLDTELGQRSIDILVDILEYKMANDQPMPLAELTAAEIAEIGDLAKVDLVKRVNNGYVLTDMGHAIAATTRSGGQPAFFDSQTKKREWLASMLLQVNETDSSLVLGFDGQIEVNDPDDGTMTISDSFVYGWANWMLERDWIEKVDDDPLEVKPTPDGVLQLAKYL